jgi:SPP1 family predicted phage head-tail adaptor
MSINIGKFRHRVSIQSMSDSTADDYNQTTQIPVTIGTRWASVKPLTGKALEYGKQIKEQVTHEIRLRYFPALTPDNLLLFGTRVFEILSVINVDERNEELIVMCSEEV